MIMVKLFCHMVWTIAFGMVIMQKPWVKSVPEMSTPLSTPCVLPTVKPAPSKNYVILLYNNLSRDVLAKRVGNVLRSCPIGAS